MKNLSRHNLILRYPEFWILLFLTLVLFPMRHAIAGVGAIQLNEVGTLAVLHPIFLGTLGIVIFLVPGMAVVVILGDDGDWWERLALAFVASSTSVGVVSELAAFLHTSIEFLLWAYLGLTVVFIVGALLRLVRFPPGSNDAVSLDRPPLWMWAILLVMVSILMVFSVNARMDPDEIDAAAYIQNIRHDPHMMLTEPELNGDFKLSVRYYFATWLTDQALISRITGQDPLDQYKAITPALTLLTLAAFHTFARRITNRRSAAVLATIAWTIYLILSNHSSVAGYEAVVRIDLDKCIAGFIIVPVGIGILKTIFDHRRLRDWVWLALAGFAAMLTHPLGVGLLGLSIVGGGLAELVTQRNRQTFWRLALAALVLTLSLTPDLGVLFSLTKRGPGQGGVLADTLMDTRDPALAQQLRTTSNLERLYLLPDGQYIMSPRLVFQPYFLPAFLALPILFWQLRRSRGARILFGMLTVIPLIILFPPTANLLGRLITPWIFYRLHWPIGLAALATVGWALDWLYDRLLTGTLPGTKLSVPKHGMAAAGVVVWLLFMAANAQNVQSNLGFQKDLMMNRSQNCLWWNDLLRPFQQLAPDPSMVLGDEMVSACSPAAAPYTGVLEYRLDATVRPYKKGGMAQKGWDRLSDFAYFKTTEVVDQRFLQILARWQIKFVVVAQSRALDSEMRHMPDMFQPLYTKNYETIYRVLSINQDAPVVQANALLTGFEFSAAASAFEKLQSSDSPDTRYLAQIGLGYAYQQLAQIDAALSVWGQAADSTKEGHPLALRAQVFGLRGEYDLAIQAYKDAIAREPNNLNWPVAMGGYLYRAHRVDESAATFEAAVAMQALPNSGSYHQMLGNIWLGLTDYDRAAQEFNQAIAITRDPNIYATLANTYISARRIPEAEALLIEMENRDSWNAQVPFLRAQIQSLSGNWQSSADLIRQSLTLHPLVPGAYDTFANVVSMQDGSPAALDQLKQLPGYRALGVGDALVNVARLEAGMGEFDQANKDLAQALIWKQSFPICWETQGDIQLAQGQLDNAAATYRRVIEASAGPQAAYLGLSQIAHAEANLELEQGYLIQAVYAQSNSPPAHVALGDFFLRQARPDLAQRQYQVALDTDPDSVAVLTAVGDFHAGRGEFDQALKYYQNALTRSPVTTPAYLRKSSVYLDQGRVPEARDAINRAIQITPGAPAPRAALAALDARQGNVDAALKGFEQLIVQNPGFGSGYVSLARLYVEQDRSSDAQSILQELLSRFPMFDTGYLGLGLLAERRGDFTGAETLYRQALDYLTPAASGSALTALGALQSRQGKRDQALQSFQTAIEQEPMLADGYVALASLWAHEGESSKATSILKQGLALSPGSAQLNAASGNLELARGYVDQAEQIYDNYLRPFPGALNIAIARANLTAALGQPQAALAQVTRLQAAWPGSSSLLAARADLELTAGDPDAALVSANKLVELFPGDTSAWLVLARVQNVRGRFAEAESALRRAVQVQPGDSGAWLALGQFLVARGQSEAASAALREAIRVNPQAIAPRLTLASLADDAGDRQEAVATLQLTADLDHRTSQALLALADLNKRTAESDVFAELDQALTRSPTEPAVYAARASAFLRAGETSSARQALEGALERNPGSCEAYQNLGAFLAGTGDFVAAATNYRRALGLPGCASSAHLAIASLYRFQGKSEAALAEYKEAIAAQPGAALPYFLLAHAYLDQNRHADAAATYIQAVSRAPASDLLALANGETLFKEGQFQRGLDLVLQATLLSPADAGNLVALGNAYEFLGRFAEAETAYRDAARMDASKPGAYFALGQLYTRQARFDDALNAYTRAVQIAPGEPLVHEQLAAYYESRGQYDAAEASYQKSIAANASRIPPLISLGRLYQARGRTEDAERIFTRALTIRADDTASSANVDSASTGPPGTAQALIGLAGLAEFRGDIQKAEDTYMRAMRASPASPDALLHLAALYWSQGKLEQARAQFERAIELAPASAQVYIALGDFEQSQLDWAAAERSYKQAAAVAPTDPAGRIALGQLYQLQGRQQDALTQFVEATRAAPASPQALLALAKGQQFYARWDDADKTYRQAIQLVPGDPGAYLGLSELYRKRGEYDAALEQARTAVRMAPSDVKAWITLGELQQLLLNWGEAEQAYKRAAAADAANPTGNIQLARLYQVQAKFDTADSIFRAAAAAAPGSSAPQLALGEWYSSQTRWSSAGAAFRQAIQLEPSNPLGYLGLGALYLAQARPDDALEQFEMARQVAPADVAPFVAIADWHRARANWQAAEENYRRAMQVAPTDPTVFVDLAEMDWGRGKAAESLALLEAAATIAPASPVARVAQGDLYQSRAEWPRAEQACRDAIAREPSYAPAHVALGKLEALLGKTNAAEQQLLQAISMWPGDPVGYVTLGDLYQAAARSGDALHEFQSAVEAAPTSAVANVALGTWYSQHADFPTADRLFRQATSRNPTSAQGHIALSSFSLQRGKTDEALALVLAARSRVPGDLNLMLELANLYTSMGRPGEAMALHQSAIDLEPGNLQARLEQAQGLFNQARFAEAEQAYRGAVNLAPGLADPYVALGDFQRQQQNWLAAAQAYEQAIALEPIRATAFTGLVNLNLAQDQTTGALNMASRWVGSAPAGQISAWITLGQVKRAAGDSDGSLAAYAVARQYAPGSVDSLVGTAQTLRAQARFGEAISVANTGLELLPTSVPAFLERGLAQETLGQLNEASESYRLASDMDQSSADANVARAHLAVANAQPQEGIQYYEQAMAARPIEYEAYYAQAQLYRSLEDLDSALSVLTRARQLIPAELNAYLQLAQVYAEKQDEAAALNVLDQAVELFPYAQSVIYTKRGDVFRRFRDAESALDAYHKAEALDPTLIVPIVAEGDLYLDQLGDSETALELYRRAAAMDGTLVYVQLKILNVYARQRFGRPTFVYDPATCPLLPRLIGCDFEGVIIHSGLDGALLAQYQEAASSAPASLEAQTALVALYQTYHLYDQAIEQWNKILAFDQADQEAYAFLSYDYSLKEEARLDAAYAAGQGMALGPVYQSAHTQLAQLYSDHITWPQNGATVSGVVTITGTAAGVNTGEHYPFGSYKVELGAGSDPQAWLLLAQSSLPVAAGNLASWDTATWPDGQYTIRLVVVDASGNYRPWDRRTIELKR